MDWKTWLHSLIAAAIGGAATAISTMIVAPDQFNLQDGWQKLLTVAVVSALVNVAAFLKQSPIPGK